RAFTQFRPGKSLSFLPYLGRMDGYAAIAPPEGSSSTVRLVRDCFLKFVWFEKITETPDGQRNATFRYGS
ncbi:hypothetical protein ACFYVL_44645, partial [Streptomyces sp. NPDC004111]|uniref:hypothetical protein n=1 Tax=Streptomyces sp. NPDC004111 TaxID=3364690 RepID=UPI0036B52B2A